MLNSDSNVILDASAFYAGIAFSGLLKYYTTDKVFEEIRHIKSSISAIEVLVQSGNLKVIEPEAKFITSAIYIAKKSGDLVKMSEADLSVIALAFELRDSNPLIITDDFAVANVGELSNIQVSYVMSKGITKVGTWLRYCPACSVLYRKNEKQCVSCGNRLRTKLTHNKKH